MDDSHAARRAFLATISLISALAAGAPMARANDPAQQAPPAVTGVFSAFLNGQFAASVADPNLAAEQFLLAVADGGSDPALLHQALLAAVMSGRPEAATLARRLPDDPVAQIFLGTEAARSGDWQASLHRFAALQESGLTRLLRPFLIAWAEQGAGQTDRALAGLEPLVSDPRFRGFYALHAGLIADQAGRTATAVRYYHLADTQIGAHSVRLSQVLASFAARQGHAAEALRTLDNAAQVTPVVRIALPALAGAIRQRPVAGPIDGLAEVYLDVASGLHQDNQDQFAMVLVRLALTLRPDFTAARMLGADILQAGHHADRALDMLAAVRPADPWSAMVTMRRAQLEAQLGRSSDALDQLHDLALAHPDSSLPDAEAGDLLRIAGDYKSAAAAYSRAIARIATPSALDWPLFYDRGVAYEQSNQWPQAEADFRKALHLEPNQPVVLNYLGYSWADRGEHLDEARKMIESAVRQRPDDGAVIDSLGWVMLRQGDATGAVSALERATELLPEDATINGHLGDAYWAAGRKMEATYQWRRALTLNPLPADAAKLEAKLHETTAQAATQQHHIP